MSFGLRLFLIIIWIVFLYLILKIVVNKAKRFNVSKPKLLFWDKTIIVLPIGFVLVFFSLFLLYIISPTSVTNIEASVFLILPLMLNLYLMLRCINWKIKFGVHDFEYTNIFGKKFIFTYSQIKSVTMERFGEVIYVRNKRIIVDVLTVGENQFLTMVDESKKKVQIKHRQK